MADGVITTSRRAGAEEIRLARKLSHTLGWPFVPRDGPIDALLGDGRRGAASDGALSGPSDGVSDPPQGAPGEARAETPRHKPPIGILVVTASRLELHTLSGLLFYHPGMAHPRIYRLRRGGRDPLVDAMRLAKGLHVLDCTLGLAADALVASYVVGSTGRVVGWESTPVIAAIVEDGLRRYEGERESVREAMRRVHVRVADYERALAETPDRSFDVVYFDPMFRRPVEQSTALHPLRAVADMRALTEGAVREAVRVARRTVVLKERRGSSTFEELGFVERRDLSSGRVAYGVIEVDGGAP